MIQKEYDDGKNHVHAISYGGGTQSTALILLALEGKINGVIPDFIIFSDTGWEDKKVYAWIQHVNEYIKAKYDREIIFTNNGSIREDLIKASQEDVRTVSLPYFTKAADGKMGIVMRQCTEQYKILPVRNKIRELMGYRKGKWIQTEKAHIWKGITTDEIQRVKPILNAKWLEAEHPLVDILEMTKQECIEYVESTGLGTPPSSACIGCPFHHDDKWLDMKKNDEESWNDAVYIDSIIRKMPKFSADLFLHRSCQPLDQVKFYEQSELDQFINECEGFCGL